MKTIRYYSDIGLLPGIERSAGGHRRYGPETLERLRLIQRLRALETPVSTIAEVVTGARSLSDLVTNELDLTYERLDRLRWRQATLEALDDCAGEERLRRLAVLARVQHLPDAHADLARTWERAFPPTMPRRLADAITAQAVPDPPSTPSPEAVLAYAELHVLAPQMAFPAPGFLPARLDVATFYSGTADACGQALEAEAADDPDQFDQALNLLVHCCARAKDTDDTPDFRRQLKATAQRLSPSDAYWHRVTVLTDDGGRNLGAAHTRLFRALSRS